MKRTFASRTFYPRTFNPVTFTGTFPTSAAAALRKPIRLKLSLGLASASGLRREVSHTPFRIDQANEGFYEETITAVQAEQLYLNETIGTPGYCFIENLNDKSQYYTDIGFSSGVYGIRLYAGEVACFRLHPDMKIYYRSGGIPQDLMISILEN